MKRKITLFSSEEKKNRTKFSTQSIKRGIEANTKRSNIILFVGYSCVFVSVQYHIKLCLCMIQKKKTDTKYHKSELCVLFFFVSKDFHNETLIC